MFIMKKLAILSDTHDHLDNIRRALALLEGRGAEGLLHLGDIVSPFALKALLKFQGPFYAIFGNNDGEKAGLRNIFPELRDGPRIFELGGRRLGVAHSVQEVPAEYWNTCDGVFYGHTHARVLKPKQGTRPLELNPGEGCGWLTGKPSCALLDLETMGAEILEIV
jgi:putative phosphoesterase